MPAAHSHDAYEETIYGLEGALTWTLDGERTEVGPGEVLCIPEGVIHRFGNDREAGAKMLAIGNPGILDPNYFREMAAGPRGARRGDAASRPHPGAMTPPPIPHAKSNASCTATPPCSEPPD